MRATFDTRSETALISLAGRFDTNARTEFARCCDAALASVNVRCIEIDLGLVEAIDRTAIAMLMDLDARAEAQHIAVFLCNCSSAVRQTFDTENLDGRLKMR